MNSRHLAQIVISGVVLLGAFAAPSIVADELAGTWKVQLIYDGRRGRVFVLQLATEGEKLSGEVMRSENVRVPIENGRFEAGKISFDVPDRWRRNSARKTVYRGTVVEDAMQGTAEYSRRGEQRSIEWTASKTTLDAIEQENSIEPAVADIQLNDSNYEIWRDHILPEPEELAWAKIDWLTTFKDGILKSEEANKPLLLWTMNGHPLGCT